MKLNQLVEILKEHERIMVSPAKPQVDVTLKDEDYDEIDLDIRNNVHGEGFKSQGLKLMDDPIGNHPGKVGKLTIFTHPYLNNEVIVRNGHYNHVSYKFNI